MRIINALKRKFTLRYYEADWACRMKPSSVLGYFQEAAGDHSAQMGLGFSDLSAQGRFWILSKMHVRVERIPKVGEELTVTTWPHKPNKAIFDRSFTLEDRNGVAVRAFSRWCILNERGRIVPTSQIEDPDIDYVIQHATEVDNWQIPQAEKECEPDFTIVIGNSEYDFNYHVNNTKYADYIFNCFSVEELEKVTAYDFQIHYLKQAHVGDTLKFYRMRLPSGEYVVEGVKNDSETVVTSRICFE